MTEHPIETATGSGLAGVMFRRSGDGLLLVDALTGQIHEANPAAERLTEFGRTELLEMSLRSMLRHEQPWHDWTLATAGDAVEVHEGFLLRTRRPDAWVPIRLEMTPVSLEGRPARLLIRLADDRAGLALRRRAERAEAGLQRVLANASECHWSARVGPGGLTYLNLSAAVERLTGRDAGAFLDSPATWSDAVVPADRPAWRAFRDRLSLGQPGSLDYRILHGGGREVRVRETAHVVPDEDGLLLFGVLGEVVEGVAAPAPPCDESLDRILGTISHDFNNLIAGILGNVSLATHDPSPANTVASLGRIESIADRAADLCRRLSTCAGRVPRNGITPDPASAIRYAVGALAASDPNVAVEVVTDADLPSLAVDPAPLSRAVEELVRNAIQAGATRVEVRLGCRSPESALPEVIPSRPETPSQGVHIQVRDDGEGISGAARGRLGEPFFTTRPGQSGLGVATVLGIARASRGAFRLHSRQGEGTIAILSFPAARPLAPAAPTAPAPVADPKPPLVLVVDDEAAVADVAARLLASAGCRVMTARDGLEAVEVYERHSAEIRLVLLDLKLPRLAGEKVVAELRRRDEQLPIVLMSGHHGLADRPELAALRLSGCLQKPFRLAEILALLERVLGLRKE